MQGKIDKAGVVKVLHDIGLLLQLKGENSFKSRAYDLGAERISGLSDEDLTRRAEAGTLGELPGIGDALSKKVAELVTTGVLPYFETLRGEFPPGILDICQLPDVGPKKAAALFRGLQIGDVTALELACREGRVQALKGFGAKTEAKLLEGIERMRRAKGRHLLGRVLPKAEALLERVLAAEGVMRASLGGSVRRACETVGDVDIVASALDPKPLMDAFVSHSSVAQVIGRGDTKCSVRLTEDDLQVDLRVLPDEDFATALHHFTGSKAHHVRLRGIAQDRGLKISEWGVFRGEEKLKVTDEEELYALLGMKFIPPELREDLGEIEAALNGTLPDDWVRESDVLGAVHSHSTWSDGRNSLEEMARTAQALGLQYLTVTEHSQSAIYAGGLSADRLRAQWDEIDALNEKLGGGFRLLKGMEVDILADGALDLDAALLDALEVVIASVHVRHSLDEDQMTARVLRALDHPRTHILGHPTGRLLNTRDPYPLKMEAVLDRAAERGVTVEVNGSPARMDLSAAHVRMAVERQVKLVASVDAHGTEQLANLGFAVATARKGWARKTDILNTLPAEAFLGRLHQR